MVRPIVAVVLFSLTLLAARAPAQHVWVVDDTAGTGADFPEPQAAINAAADGDTILVRAGVYDNAFIIDGKALTLAADAGAAVHVSAFRVRHVAAGQAVAVIGLVADRFNQAGLPGVEVVRITDCAGPVLVQDCALFGGTTFTAPPLSPTVNVVNAAAVSLVRCTLFGRIDFATLSSLPVLTAEALSCTASHVQLAHCVVSGAPGNSLGGPHPVTAGKQAIALAGSRLVLLGTTVAGGAGGNGGPIFMGGCASGEAGGAGVALLDAPSECFHRASTVSGGAGGLGGGCLPGAAGAAFTGPGVVTSLAGDSQPLDITPAVVREGGAGLLQLHAAPGSAALLLLGFGQSQLWLPSHAGVLLPSSSALVVPLGAMPGSGVLALPYVVPTLPAGVEGITVVLQSAFAGGGPALLGGSGALVIIGAGF